MNQEPKHTNNLIHETSPYLLQHAHNPVQWNPWEKQALSRAKKENKPIFLSIGYSSCHWCHVMERESFQNSEIADILNKNFISIKVDREERPDIDDIYMSAVVALSGRGGWPLSVFLTPDLKPFFGGTYFPPEDRPGMVGFKRLILRISEIWGQKKQREKIILDADRLTQALEQRMSEDIPETSHEKLNKKVLHKASEGLEKTFDPEWGGFGSAPKFPPCGAVSFLFFIYHHTKDKNSLKKATITLDRMQAGGLYDHLAGGFHRYSTDRKWLVPHFEKMLYDNARLASVYSQAYLVTGKRSYSKTAQNTLKYVRDYLTDASGGFYSAEDADVQGKEGLFYLWEKYEINDVLDKKEADIFSQYYQVKKEGNFPYQESYHKGKNILHTKDGLSLLSQKYSLSEKEAQNVLEAARSKLLKVRNQRVRPFLDDKIITSWNSLMISAFCQAYQVWDNPQYLTQAQNAAQFIVHNLSSKEGMLFRSYRSGEKKHYAYLEDYAFFVRSLIDLYESDFNTEWINHAERYAEDMIQFFWDDEKEHFYNTHKHHENQLVRTMTLNDSAIPSPSGMAVDDLIYLGRLFQKKEYLKKSEKILKSLQNKMTHYPQSYMKMLLNVSSLVYPEKEVAVVGKQNSKQTKRLMRTIWERFIPNRVLAFLDPGQKDSVTLAAKIPLLKNKTLVDGKSAVYVCENYQCQNPVTEPEQLERQL